jgi:hypothetical protein
MMLILSANSVLSMVEHARTGIGACNMGGVYAWIGVGRLGLQIGWMSWGEAGIRAAKRGHGARWRSGAGQCPGLWGGRSRLVILHNACELPISRSW